MSVFLPIPASINSFLPSPHSQGSRSSSAPRSCYLPLSVLAHMSACPFLLQSSTPPPITLPAQCLEQLQEPLSSICALPRPTGMPMSVPTYLSPPPINPFLPYWVPPLPSIYLCPCVSSPPLTLPALCLGHSPPQQLTVPFSACPPRTWSWWSASTPAWASSWLTCCHSWTVALCWALSVPTINRSRGGAAGDQKGSRRSAELGGATGVMGLWRGAGAGIKAGGEIQPCGCTKPYGEGRSL